MRPPDDAEPLRLVTALADASQRSQAVGALAQYVGAEGALVFLTDPETGAMLPAPGFLKTLPGRAVWRPFLDRCLQEGMDTAEVPFPDMGTMARTMGRRIAPGAVLALVGGVPDAEKVEAVSRYFPLLVAALRGEQEIRIAGGQEKAARDAAAQLSTVAEALDATRVQYQSALQVANTATEAIQKELGERRRIETELRAQSHIVETISRVNASLVAELDLDKLVQAVTDAGTDLTGAQFGAFFYNVVNAEGEAFMLYTVSGVPREAFSKFPMPRNTPIFAPTFAGEGVVRLDDVTRDPRYGTMAPHFGMPKGHLPVRSYLAVPVVSRKSEVIGGLFFGHAAAGVFTPEAERIVLAIADQAAIAIENARMLQDIRSAEARLRALNESLEERVLRRTDELRKEVAERTRAEASLAHAVSQLEERNRELQEFAYVASHDLQEPLRKVSTFSSLLASEYGAQLGEEGGAYLERMQNATGRMSKLIRDLLDYSRVATHGHRFERTDLGQVVSGVLSDLEVLIHDVKGRVEVGPMPEIVAEPMQMRQLFQNLIGNALKFHRPDVPPLVRLSAVPVPSEAGPACAYRIEVQDNGIGFDERYLDRIFIPFQRLHGRGEYEGTGIGLAITKRIVSRHGGTITAQSRPGQGSTFVVELPVDQASDGR